jgi:LysM repeat protein
LQDELFPCTCRYDPAPTPAAGPDQTPGTPHPMKRKRSWISRILALAALAGAIVAIVIVAKNTDLHSNSDNKGNKKNQVHKEQQKKPRTKAKTYTVQPGDTLTSISHKTGIPIAELQALNPEIDPQILTEGETLKLQK